MGGRQGWPGRPKTNAGRTAGTSWGTLSTSGWQEPPTARYSGAGHSHTWPRQMAGPLQGTEGPQAP